MRDVRVRHSLLLTLVLALTAAVALAADVAPGTYRCSAYNVSGGGGSCRNVPRLILSPDGTYRYSSTQGRWSTEGGRLRLSESTLWGDGEIVGPGTVRFQYEYRGWRHTVTWLCEDCARRVAPPGPSPSAPASGAGFVGVSLTLEFGRGVGGVSGFVIVPAEAARQYVHNAPLPEGAVQGLAWEVSASAVALATGRTNRLRSGRRYVVFLSWPRESIPVAILDLPPASADHTATLPATLDGASVLARLGR